MAGEDDEQLCLPGLVGQSVTTKGGESSYREAWYSDCIASVNHGRKPGKPTGMWSSAVVTVEASRFSAAVYGAGDVC